MEINGKIHLLEQNLSRQLDWIRAADTKVAPVMFITSSMLGAAAAVLSRAETIYAVTLLLAVLTIIPLLCTLFFIAMANFPRFNPDTGSIIFFEAINKAGLSAFEQKAKDITEEEYFRDLSAMCYNSAHIATLKFRHLKKATIFLFIAIIPWVALIYNIFRSYYIAGHLGK